MPSPVREAAKILAAVPVQSRLFMMAYNKALLFDNASENALTFPDGRC